MLDGTRFSCSAATACSAVCVAIHGATAASTSSARSKRSAAAYSESSAIRWTASHVMQKWSHCSRLAAPTLNHLPSPAWNKPIGWNDSPKRRPQRPFTPPVWVYMVSVHWWLAATASIAPTSTSWPSPVRAECIAAAAAPIAAQQPCWYAAHGPPPCNGSRSGSPVMYA